MSDSHVQEAAAFPRGRWLQLWLGILCMVLIANLQYAWTLFVGPMSTAHGWKLGDIQWAFTIFIATETWITPFAGFVSDRLGPRRGPRLIILIGGVMVGLGWTINAHAATLGMLYTGAAVSGLGAGGIYAICVGNAVKWFPDRRGLAVGMTAAGFGAGAALTVVPIRWVIAEHGYSAAFLWFGIGQALILLVVAFVLHAPDEVLFAPRAIAQRLNQSARSFTSGEMLRSPVFWLMYFMFVLDAATGLMATAQLAPIAKDFGVANVPILFGATALSVALVVDNIMNGMARPFFGWVSDHLGREWTMGLAFSLGAFSYGLLAMAAHTPWAFVICAALIFFTWGEIFSLFPSLCSDTFGPKFATSNVALLYTAKGTSAFLVPFANVLQGATGDWATVFIVAASADVLVAGLAVFALRPLRLRVMSNP